MGISRNTAKIGAGTFEKQKRAMVSPAGVLPFLNAYSLVDLRLA